MTMPDLKLLIKGIWNHLSPWILNWRAKKDHKSQLIQWNQEFKEGKSIRFLLFLKDNPEGEIIGFFNFTQIFRGPFQACYLAQVQWP